MKPFFFPFPNFDSLKANVRDSVLEICESVMKRFSVFRQKIKIYRNERVSFIKACFENMYKMLP